MNKKVSMEKGKYGPRVAITALFSLPFFSSIVLAATSRASCDQLRLLVLELVPLSSTMIPEFPQNDLDARQGEEALVGFIAPAGSSAA